MKVQKAQLAENKFVWFVLGDDYLPIKPIHEFIRYLNNIERSPNTLRAYANHLKLYWEYLNDHKKTWDMIKLNDIAEFVFWLRLQNSKIISINQSESKRTESTINAILTALSSFYDFHKQIGKNVIQLTQMVNSSPRQYKPLLHHISKSKPVKSRLIKIKQRKTIPKTITNDQVKLLIDACHSHRDKFLIYLLYETGMRIGQALGLHHEDIKSWDNEIHIKFRSCNINGARSKTSSLNVIHVTKKVIDLYNQYLTHEYNALDNSYVFIQTKTESYGTPLAYSAVIDLFIRLSKKINIKVRPHMLRHTHATELIRNGWDSSYVQKRLGHANVQTTLNAYTHLTDNDLKDAFKKYQQSRSKS